MSVDNDRGYYIYSVLKQPINLAFESHHGHPAARFIGMSSLTPTIRLLSHVTMPLTEEDRRAPRDTRIPWFASKPCKREIKHMETLGVKLVSSCRPTSTSAS